jgi:hypothetical protein
MYVPEDLRDSYVLMGEWVFAQDEAGFELSSIFDAIAQGTELTSLKNELSSDPYALVGYMFPNESCPEWND